MLGIYYLPEINLTMSWLVSVRICANHVAIVTKTLDQKRLVHVVKAAVNLSERESVKGSKQSD